MSETPDTIRLEIPKARVEADLVGLSGHLGSAALHGAALGNWPGTIAELFSAAKTIRIDRSEGALAWELLLTGIGEALTELANQQPPRSINEDEVRAITKLIGREATDLVIPADFLEHPWNLPPVALAKKTLLTWLAPEAGVSSLQNQDMINLGRRFDAALVLGLHRAIRQNKARYQPVLALRDDPTRPAWQVMEDWRLYQAHVLSEYKVVPVFDESFALDQIYVPLNAWHKEMHVVDLDKDPKEVRAVVALTDDILAWLRGERYGGKLRLISGGPGSGKSSVMKALAAELVQKGNNGCPVDVLLFPLQRFQWRSDIIESIAATLNAYGDQMRHNPLDPEHLRHRDTPLLLIFDGLDELTASMEVSEAISATFLRELSATLRSWTDRPVWAIVTGRDAIFGNVQGPTAPLPGEQFHLLPYHVRKNEQNAPGRDEYHDPGQFLEVDNREKAFRRFAEAKGKREKDLPAAYSNDDLHDVSTQPLLNYFMLTSGPDEIGDGNLARIYSHLFERLHVRNRNISGRPQDAGKPAAGLTQDEFNRVFEVMAVAAWRTGGTRAAGWQEILDEVGREDTYLSSGEGTLRDIFDTQMQDRGARKPFRLAAGFFLRNEQAIGVEFTHKSFGDYLYARRLAKALSKMADALITTPEVQREMLHRWEELTSEQQMSHEVFHFLKLEIEATVDINSLNKRHDILTPVVKQVLQEGWQVKKEGSCRRKEQHSCQMEEALFAAWHAMWRSSDNRRYWTFGENTGDLLCRALSRLRAASDRRSLSIFGRNFSGVNLEGTSLIYADLKDANLEEANLRDADLIGAVLRGAVLRGANLEDAHLEDANLREADLRDAVLRGANLEDAILTGANLQGANLEEAILGDAYLRGAYLRGAYLRGAYLRGADLRGANLRGAHLKGADLRGANLRGADLGNANLQGAILTDANLQDAILTGANLQGANLQGANREDSIHRRERTLRRLI